MTDEPDAPEELEEGGPDGTPDAPEVEETPVIASTDRFYCESHDLFVRADSLDQAIMLVCMFQKVERPQVRVGTAKRWAKLGERILQSCPKPGTGIEADPENGIEAIPEEPGYEYVIRKV